MTTTLPADTPITGDLSPDQIADYIDLAAKLIDRDGLEVGDLWTCALLEPYSSDTSCCTAGALAVVCGYRSARDVEAGFLDVAHDDNDNDRPWTPHPVFAAVMAALGFDSPEDLYDWSDSAGADTVIEALHTAAEKVRAEQLGAAS